MKVKKNKNVNYILLLTRRCSHMTTAPIQRVHVERMVYDPCHRTYITNYTTYYNNI